MKNCFLFLFFLSPLAVFCQKNTDEAIWKLSWRMVAAASWDKNPALAASQFDSLLKMTDKLEARFLATGLEVMSKMGKTDEIVVLLNQQNETSLREICPKQFLTEMEPCWGYTVEKITNKALQQELIRMFVFDQAARDNLKSELIELYNIDTTGINKDNSILVDEHNRNRLKEIITEYGFPTLKLVGKDAMRAVFILLQHADGDTEWQMSQLENVKIAVKNGDMEGQFYAYLYDRIKINNGEKQLYGTQFAKVDSKNKTVELADTEDVENLNKRRMEMGMMPIEMYKAYIFKH